MENQIEMECRCMNSMDQIRLWGPINDYSGGMGVVMADRQIKRAIDNGSISFDDSMGNGTAVITCKSNGKWFVINGGWDNNNVHTCMLGAICGDIAGSTYEHRNIKHKLPQDALIHKYAMFTDDTVMTCAVADGLRKGLANLPVQWLSAPNAESVLTTSVQEQLLLYGRRYPHAGYGSSFYNWLTSQHPQPYNSWGNGSAMRASYAGWVAQTLEEAEKLGEISAKVTHNHPEGIKGAVVVAGCIFLLRNGADKDEICSYVCQHYNMDFSLDEIRSAYSFDVSCAGSVPQAIEAFLEGDSFCDVIANAISIGGDSDTIAAIAGSIAEVIYPIPQDIRGEIIDRLDNCLLDSIRDAADFMFQRQHN